MISEITDSKNSSHKSKLPSIITIDGQNYNTSSDVFLDKLCDFFANVGASMCGNNQATPFQVEIHTKNCLKSFVLQEITEKEVSNCFKQN